MHHRRLVHDYETRPDNFVSMIILAMIGNLATHLTTETTPTWRYDQTHITGKLRGPDVL